MWLPCTSIYGWGSHHSATTMDSSFHHDNFHLSNNHHLKDKEEEELPKRMKNSLIEEKAGSDLCNNFSISGSNTSYGKGCKTADEFLSSLQAMAFSKDNHPTLENSQNKETTKVSSTGSKQNKFKIPIEASNFIYIEKNEYKSSTGQRSNGILLEESTPCECDFKPSGGNGKHEACGEESNCINRLLLVECDSDCPCGHHCQNKRFQRQDYAKISITETPGKGFGIVANQDISNGQFIIEYVGEVLNQTSFHKRSAKYAEEATPHFYFMTLTVDEVIDASLKGNISRFMNHSCAPNCATQKWIVNKKLRIGIFAIKDIPQGSELTFDYKFEVYGTEPQKCYCGEVACKGVIGTQKKASSTDSFDLEDDGSESSFKPKSKLSKKGVSGLEDPEDIPKIIKFILQIDQTDTLVKYLRILSATTHIVCLRRFLHLHGLKIIHALMLQYKKDANVLLIILKFLKNLPVSTKNSVLDSKLEPLLKKISVNYEHDEIAELTNSIMETWSQLEMIYRIPKAGSSHMISTENTAPSPKPPSQEPPAYWGTHNPHDSSSGGLNESLSELQEKKGTCYTESPLILLKDAPVKDIFDELVHKVPESLKKSSIHSWFPATRDRDTNREHDEKKFSNKKRSQENDLEEKDSPSLQLPPSQPIYDPLGNLLPVNWRWAHDDQGIVYYFNIITKFTQWELPVDNTAPLSSSDTSVHQISTYEIEKAIQKAKVSADKAKLELEKEAEQALIQKEKSSKLRDQISNIVIKFMSKFKAQINTEEFKRLARKLTHALLEKEQKLRETKKDTAPMLDSDYIDKRSRKKMKLFLKEYLCKLGYKKPDAILNGRNESKRNKKNENISNVKDSL